LLKWNRYSIRKQLIFLYIIVQLILLVVVMLYYNYNQRKAYLNQLQEGLFSQAILIKENIANNGIKLSNIDKWTKELGKKLNKRITIISQEGVVIADSEYEISEMDNHNDRPEVQAVLSGEESGISIRESETLDIDMYYLAVSFDNGSLTGFIRLSKSLEDINNMISANIKSNLLFFLLIILLALLLVWNLTTDIINPLGEIAEMAGKMAEGNFQDKIKIKYDNEIGILARTFNYMAAQLENKINQISDEKNRAEAILTSMADGLIAADTDLKIQVLNPATQRIFSLKDIQWKGKRIIEIFRYHEIEDYLERAVQEDKILSAELQIQEGDLRILRCNFAPINNNQGKAVGGIVVFNDITELRKLEQMRKDFVGNVSHELRTPLTSIIGYVDTLLENEIEDQDIMKRFLKIIKKEADRLALLIKDLLDLSKLESKNSYVLRPGLLNDVIDKTIQMFNDKADSKNIKLRKAVVPELMVYMIPEQIEQVLINLLDNAIKYTLEGGKVSIKAFFKNNKVVVEVSDNGIGIPNNEQHRIFERFYRVDKARTRSFGGTGIGLSIVKHIIQNHKNKIELESKSGQGSTFRFYLDKFK